MEEILKEILGEIRGLKDGQEQLRNDMDTRFNKVDDELKAISKKLEVIQNRQAMHGQRL